MTHLEKTMKPNVFLCVGLVAGLTAGLTAGFVPAPASALEWTAVDISLFTPLASDAPTDQRYPRIDTAPRGIKVYIGRGDIVAGDAERLLALYNSPGGGDRALGRASRDAFPEVWLDSPGGDPFEGFRIGQVIRDLRLATVVPEGAWCASACTMAFLGGVERRIEGPYLIHAASPVDAAIDMTQILDTVQWFSAVYVNYARSMVGDATVAEAALAFGTGGAEQDALPLDDAELRDWGVITVAARPGQGYAPESLQTINCAENALPRVSALMCNDLTLGGYDARISAALTALAELSDREGTTSAAIAASQQERWQAVRDACEDKASTYTPLPFPVGDGQQINPVTGAMEPVTGADAASAMIRLLLERQEPDNGSGTYAVQACLLDVYGARARQLEAMIAYGEATATARLAGWE